MLQSRQNGQYFASCYSRSVTFSHLHSPPIQELADIVIDGWFRETNELWPGQAWTLKVDQVLHHEKSQHHDILVFDSPEYGSILAVDGAIQCIERDEFGYSHKNHHITSNIEILT